MNSPLSTETETLRKPGEPNHCQFCGSPYMEIDRMAAEIHRLKAKLEEVARLLDEGAYGMATDEARGA